MPDTNFLITSVAEWYTNAENMELSCQQARLHTRYTGRENRVHAHKINEECNDNCVIYRVGQQ